MSLPSIDAFQVQTFFIYSNIHHFRFQNLRITEFFFWSVWFNCLIIGDVALIYQFQVEYFNSLTQDAPNIL